MASSYSTDLKLELMVTGENSGTWGDKTNTNLQLIQQAVAGYEAVALTDSGTVALAMTQEALSNARNMVIKFTGTLTGASTVTIPDGIEKFYIFDLSAVTGVTNLTIKTVSGTGFTAGEAKIVAAYSDGTNLNEIALNTLGGTIGSAQIDNNAITTALLNTAAVTTTRLDTNAVNTARLDTGAVTTSRVGASAITQAKLAADSVGPNQLIATGVSAAEYTTATITVDADGRITAASSGSAGDTNLVLAFSDATGNSTGTYTANPAATKIHAYLAGGGGGGGGRYLNFPGPAKEGGNGGFGLFSVPISAPYSVPYSIGAGGAAGIGPIPGDTGDAGGQTVLNTNLIANGGNGGGAQSSDSPGNPGNAPGATISYISPSTPFNQAAGILSKFGSPGYGTDQITTTARGGRGGQGSFTPSQNGQVGSPGQIIIYENNLG